MLKSGKDYFLRIYIDKENGIDLNDCEKVSNEINDILDQADYIDKQYFLEVSSPGIERILRKDEHFKQNIGNEVEIKLFRPIDKQKSFKGILEKIDNEKVYIKIELEEKVFDKKDIAQVKTKYNW